MANTFSKHLTARLLSITSLASLMSGCSLAKHLPFIREPPPPFDANNIQEAYEICLKKNNAIPPDETQEEYDARIPEALKKGNQASPYIYKPKYLDRILTIKTTCFSSYNLRQFGYDKRRRQNHRGIYVMVGEVERIRIPYDKSVGYSYDDKERRPRIETIRSSLTVYPYVPPKKD